MEQDPTRGSHSPSALFVRGCLSRPARRSGRPCSARDYVTSLRKWGPFARIIFSEQRLYASTMTSPPCYEPSEDHPDTSPRRALRNDLFRSVRLRDSTCQVSLINPKTAELFMSRLLLTSRLNVFFLCVRRRFIQAGWFSFRSAHSRPSFPSAEEQTASPRTAHLVLTFYSGMRNLSRRFHVSS